MNDFIQIASNPVPAGGEIITFDAADGAKLRSAIFPTNNARGTVVLLNGRCEFIEKYFEVIEDLRARGFCVATMDWRGQGLSSRLLPDSQKGHILNFDIFKSDLQDFIEKIVRPRLPGPAILMTHSMGGLPSLLLLADGYDYFARAILCAPMTRIFPGRNMQIFARMLSGAARRIGLAGANVAGVKEYSMAFEGNQLTSDEKRHERFRALQAAAPHACVYALTYGWLNAAIKAMDNIHQPGRLDGVKTPVLFISAENDALVDPSDHSELAAVNSAIQSITIKGALHEIMMERDEIRDQYWKAFDEFIAPVFEGD